MQVHRVAQLPAQSGLKAGDLYNVKRPQDDTWEAWKVDKNGVPFLVTGLTKEEQEKLGELTPELIQKLKDINPADNGIHIGTDTPKNDGDLWVDPSVTVPIAPEVAPEIAAIKDEMRSMWEYIDKFNYMKENNMDSGNFQNKAGDVIFKNNTPIEPGSPDDPTFNPDNDNYLPIGRAAGLLDPDPNRPEDGYPLDVGEGVDPELDPKDYTVKHIRIKRDINANFKPDTLMDGELGYIKDRNLLYIGNDGKPRLINGGGGGNEGGGENVATTHIDLKESWRDAGEIEDSVVWWRMKVISDNGEDPKLIIYDAAVDTAKDPILLPPGTDGEPEQLKGLLISMIYCGGEDGTISQDNPVSHSFVELYNYSTKPINLKGCSLQYAKSGTQWSVIPLSGIVYPSRAFTIRGAQCAPIGLNTTLVDIGKDDFDLDAPSMRLPNTQVKIFLTVGVSPSEYANPFTISGSGKNLARGYIDLAGIGGVLTSQTIDGYETAYPNILNKNRAIYRIYLADYNQRPAGERYGDTNNNANDFNYIEYGRNLWVDNSKVFKPMTTKSGKKTIYYDKTSWDVDKPNMVTNGLGRDGHKTRTFNWISVGYHDEYLRYRKKGTTDWTTVASINSPTSLYKRRVVKGFDGIWFTVHKQIISVTEGDWEYQVGRFEEGSTYMSPIHTFNVTNYDNTTPFGLVVTTDQQAWSWEEYEPWRIAVEHIEKWENDKEPKYPATGTKKIDYYINTGDMTENGIRPHEWKYYFDAGKDIHPNYAQMNVVGNNDLCPLPGQLIGKESPESFDWFYTYEHNPNNVPMYNGETMKSVYSYDYGMVHWVVLNTNNYIEEQKAWFINDMKEVHSRPPETRPRWIVVKMHDACFNIINNSARPHRDTGFNQHGLGEPVTPKSYSWSRMFEEWGVHLVISGHKHTYARSKPLLEKVVNGLVDPLNPIAQTLGNPSTGEVKVTEITGVVYLMGQATGSKLDSNKDVPASSIYWNAKYFPEGSNGKSNPAQYYPTYIKLNFTTDKITHHSYQIKNIMPAKSYSYDAFNPITLPKERIEIDTSDIIKKWKEIQV